ncbi:MAG: hypothetical protein ACYC26_10145 [Phycisphaerales bacterium]
MSHTPIDKFVAQCRPWVRVNKDGVPTTKEDYVVFVTLRRLHGLLQIAGHHQAVTGDEPARLWHQLWWSDRDIADVHNGWQAVKTWLETHANPIVVAHQLSKHILIQTRLHDSGAETQIAAGIMWGLAKESRAKGQYTFKCGRREIAIEFNRWCINKRGVVEPDQSVGKSKFITLTANDVIERVNAPEGEQGDGWLSRSEWRWILCDIHADQTQANAPANTCDHSPTLYFHLPNCLQMRSHRQRSQNIQTTP